VPGWRDPLPPRTARTTGREPIDRSRRRTRRSRSTCAGCRCSPWRRPVRTCSMPSPMTRRVSDRTNRIPATEGIPALPAKLGTALNELAATRATAARGTAGDEDQLCTPEVVCARDARHRDVAPHSAQYETQHRQVHRWRNPDSRLSTSRATNNRRRNQACYYARLATEQNARTCCQSSFQDRMGDSPGDREPVRGQGAAGRQTRRAPLP
jgi:hypothetical protein